MRDLTALGKFEAAEKAAAPAIDGGKADVLQELAVLKAAEGLPEAAQDIVDGLRVRYGDSQADDAALRVRWLVRDPQGAAAILERLQGRGEADRGSMRAFLALFHDRPAAEAAEALRAIAQRLAAHSLALFADELHDWHRDDLAWTLLEKAPGHDPVVYELQHRMLRRTKGPEAAAAWVAAHPFPCESQDELEARALVAANRDLLFDLPLPTTPAESARLLRERASALAMARETSGPRWERLRALLRQRPAGEASTLVARVLSGLAPADDLVREPVPRASLPAIAFALGNLAERDGKLSEAVAWYQDAIAFPDSPRGAERFAWERLRMLQRSGRSLERIAAEGLGD